MVTSGPGLNRLSNWYYSLFYNQITLIFILWKTYGLLYHIVYCELWSVVCHAISIICGTRKSTLIVCYFNNLWNSEVNFVFCYCRHCLVLWESIILSAFKRWGCKQTIQCLWQAIIFTVITDNWSHKGTYNTTINEWATGTILDNLKWKSLITGIYNKTNRQTDGIQTGCRHTERLVSMANSTL